MLLVSLQILAIPSVIMRCKWKYLLCIFNIFGILNIGSNENGIFLSKLIIISNVIKVLLFLISKDFLTNLLYKFASSGFSEMSYSPFAELFMMILGDTAASFCNMVIILQLINSQKNFILIENMKVFKSQLISSNPRAADSFDRYERTCSRMIAILAVVSGSIMVLGFIGSMEFSLPSLLAYFLFCLPYFVNMAFVCFFFLLVQFLVYSQDALNSYAKAAMDKNFTIDALQGFEQIAKMQLVLFSIKNEFLSTLSLQIFLLIFHYVTETVSHVSLNLV